MFQRKPRRFRRRSNDRGGYSHGGSNLRARLRSNSFSNGQSKNKFKPILSAEKLLEKYNLLAKEALSNGDKILSESYYQYADHFLRIFESRNSVQSNSKLNVENFSTKKDSEEKAVLEDKTSSSTPKSQDNN